MASPKRMKPRLLPFVIGAAVLLLTLKVDVLWHGRGSIAQDAMAQTATNALSPSQFQHTDAGNPADAVPQRDANPPAVTPAPMTPPGGTGSAGMAAGQAAFAGGAPDQGGGTNCSQADPQVLSDVAQRRAQLDKKSEELDRKALLLKAVEQRLDGKIKKLQQMQDDIHAMLGQVDQQQQQRLDSLVHIYENMKPQFAAGILQQMDMPVLIQILSRMRDLKTAPILAAMDPAKARAVTLALAQKQQLPPGAQAAGGPSN